MSCAIEKPVDLFNNAIPYVFRDYVGYSSAFFRHGQNRDVWGFVTLPGGGYFFARSVLERSWVFGALLEKGGKRQG